MDSSRAVQATYGQKTTRCKTSLSTDIEGGGGRGVMGGADERGEEESTIDVIPKNKKAGDEVVVGGGGGGFAGEMMKMIQSVHYQVSRLVCL